LLNGANEAELTLTENPDPPTKGFTPGSDLAKALEDWVDNPSSEIYLATKKGKVRYVLLGYQLPGGQWVNNSPDLWDAIRYFGPKIVAENPQESIALGEKLQSLGIDVPGVIDLEMAERLVSFRESPETAPKPDSGIPLEYLEYLEYQVECYMHSLRQGEDYLAARIAGIIRGGLKDPQRALEFVREWKDKIHEKNRPALLTSGIAAISDLWNNKRTDDQNILQEALEFGREALEIEESPYTYCALQAIYRALGQDDKADYYIREADRHGKPCQDTGRKIRRISATRDV
jgi:tetratricopeptide (TPR) repeat protein